MIAKKNMPQIDYFQWDRILLLKLICIIEMTVSSTLLLLYVYLSLLQDWTSAPETRYNVRQYKWMIMFTTLIDFILGSLVGYASNLEKKFRRPKLILWILFDTFLLPVNIFILKKLHYEITNATPLSTDIHIHRITLVHITYTLTHFFFIMGIINFLAYYTPVVKAYDPFALPDSIFEPTDPKITTTESRHIRFSESFLQPNLQKFQDPEASTSTKSQFQVSAGTGCAAKSNHHLMKLKFLPLLSFYCLKQFSHFLLTHEKCKDEKIKANRSFGSNSVFTQFTKFQPIWN